MDNKIFIDSLRNSFVKLGKDISHLSDKEIEEKILIFTKKNEEWNLNVNDSENYLNAVYEVFGI